MSLKINKDLLPTKYVLEVYKMVEGYPSTIDLLYEVVRILEDREALEKEFQATEMLREVAVRINDEDLDVSLNRLSTEGWLTKDGNAYKLTRHPWMAETI